MMVVHAPSIRMVGAPSLRICQGGCGTWVSPCHDLSKWWWVHPLSGSVKNDLRYPWVRPLSGIWGSKDSFSRRLGSLDLEIILEFGKFLKEGGK
jgi:hypothetical protein